MNLVKDKKLRTIVQKYTGRIVRCPICNKLIKAYKIKVHKKKHRKLQRQFITETVVS